ncbi:hypothetical protein HDU97_005974 [Phlyctochytrium planicorne]|nr:hypothetical protein HDU97_005974 [Phlyctochytrium planicorne]
MSDEEGRKEEEKTALSSTPGTPESSNAAPGGRPRRNAALVAEGNIASSSKKRKEGNGPLTPEDKVARPFGDLHIKSHLASGKKVRLKRMPSKSKRKTNEEMSDETCFMCGKLLPLDTHAQNLHIDDCLRNQSKLLDLSAASNPPLSGSAPRGVSPVVEEYTWAGQTRVRITTMLEGGFEASGFDVRKQSDKEDVDVDIDGNEEEQYGSAQYSEQSLKRKDEEDETDAGLKVTPPSHKNVQTDSNLVMEALKSRVKELVYEMNLY